MTKKYGFERLDNKYTPKNKKKDQGFIEEDSGTYAVVSMFMLACAFLFPVFFSEFIGAI